MGLRKTRLEDHRFGKLRMCCRKVSRLQENQPKIVVSFREIRIAAYEVPEDIGCASRVIVLAKDQSQLDSGVGVLGI